MAGINGTTCSLENNKNLNDWDTLIFADTIVPNDEILKFGIIICLKQYISFDYLKGLWSLSTS